MAEIGRDDATQVAEFIEKTYKVPSDSSKSYAAIAVMLSDEKEFKSRLERVDAWLGTVHATAVQERAFDPPATHNSHSGRDAKKEGFNVTSRLLNACANSLGWGTGGSLVMSGFTHPPDFVRVVQRKLMWKDMVASGHGEFTHIVQWLVIYTLMYGQAPELFSKACDYTSADGGFNDGRKTYLWDFIVDCFPTPPATDWKVAPRSSTARSPTRANAFIFETKFLGARLKNRYEKRRWIEPSDSVPAYTGTALHSHAKHLGEGAAPVALEGDEARDARKIFPGKKDFKGLLTTGYPKANSPEDVKLKRTGFLFARPDEVLQTNSTLMQIVQRTPLFL